MAILELYWDNGKEMQTINQKDALNILALGFRVGGFGLRISEGFRAYWGLEIYRHPS